MSSRPRKRCREDTTEETDSASHGAASPAAHPQDPPAGHGYGTRRSTQTGRPGVAAGLAPRSRGDIEAEATRKKEAHAAKKATELREQKAKAEGMRKASKRIAETMDKKAREEAEAIARMNQTPPPEEPEDEESDGVAPAHQDGSFSVGRANSRSPQRPDEAMDLDFLDQHPTSLRSPHPLESDDDGSIFQPSVYQPSLVSDFEDTGDSEEEDVPHALPAKTSQAVLQASRTTSSSKPKKAVTSNGKEKPVDPETGNVAAAQGKQKKLTAKERRERRTAVVYGDIAANREVGPDGRTAGHTRPSVSAKGKVPVNSAPKGDAFTADYRRRIRSGSTPTSNRSVAELTPALQDQFNLDFLDNDVRTTPTTELASGHLAWMQTNFGPETPTPLAASSSRVMVRANPATLSDEEIHGFDDRAVTTPRPRKQNLTVRASLSTPKNSMVAIIPNATIQGDSLASGPVKRARAPRKAVEAEASRALLGLPEWVQATIISVIIPCLTKHYGARDFPWDVDGKSKTDFKNILTALLRRLHPDQRHDVHPGEKIWAFTRQALSDWKAGFAKVADRIVRNAAKGAAPAEIARWAKNALAKGGEAIHSIPNILDHKEARGAMQSTYIVQLLAYHLETTEGAIIDTGPPVGALALASVAIRRAFGLWLTGSFVASKDRFCENVYGRATTRAREGNVAGLLKHRHRLDTLIATAMSQVPSFKEAEAQQAQQAEDDDDAYDAVDPSSSPSHDLF